MRRFLLIFSAAICVTALIHELGHALAGLSQGLIVVPTPFKEYVLDPAVEWRQYRLLALGGPLGTVVAVIASGAWFLRHRTADAEAAFVGALLTPAAYSLRFLIAGRGHDGLEWPAAQAAIGLDPTGHALDLVLLALVMVGAYAWIRVRRDQLSARTLAKASGLFVVGILVLIGGQIGNNALFDPVLPHHTIEHVPAEVLAIRE